MSFKCSTEIRPSTPTHCKLWAESVGCRFMHGEYDYGPIVCWFFSSHKKECTRLKSDINGYLRCAACLKAEGR